MCETQHIPAQLNKSNEIPGEQLLPQLQATGQC